MTDRNLIFDFDKEDDVYNRDVYNYMLNMRKLRKELDQLKQENLAHKKMKELFEKHYTEYAKNCKPE